MRRPYTLVDASDRITELVGAQYDTIDAEGV